MSALPRRHFLTWDQPLLPQAAAFLAGDWTGPAPLDLSRVIVVVPTREAGRRLREALAEHAAKRGAAVFPPRVHTPETLMGRLESGAPSRLESLLAWVDVFRAVDLAHWREVFPIDPPVRDFNWALRLADQFARLQGTLAENGLRIADVPARVGADFPEIARWEQLAGLEQVQAERLRRAGLRPLARTIEPETILAGFDGIDRVVVLATADPLPCVVALLEARPLAMTADVVVWAPANLAAGFDPWGRPVNEYWARRNLALADFNSRVHLCSDPADEAARIAAAAARYVAGAAGVGPASEGWLAVGLVDPAIIPLAEGEMKRAGVVAFNPEGRLRNTGRLFHLVAALGRLAEAPTFDAVATLVRCPDVLAFLATRNGASSGASLLVELDRLRERHLPADLAAAQAKAKGALKPALAWIATMRATLCDCPFPENIASVLADLFVGRDFTGGGEREVRFQADATAWMKTLRECATASARFSSLAATEWWQIALRLFGDSREAEEKPPGAVELQGWLELIFVDAPHLVVAGLNDGMVPEAVTEDEFLPESLRARLGLKTNAARFARDAYLLQALAAGREHRGRLDLLFAKTSPAGDPLRPSRLLLRCPDEALPERIDFLFRAPEAVSSHLPWRRAWRLQPPVVAAPAQVAVTALRRWLACPLRFYLRHVLRMEAFDPAKTEMDAFDFGTLCHAAFEAMGRDPALRDCTDPAVLRDFLAAELARHVRARFGADLSLPLLIQVESARQRLNKLAELQARERSDGWVIEAVERPFAVEIAGVTVKGKIDRIDRNRHTGAVRVVDYKTSDTAVTPAGAHLRPLRSDDLAPEWARCLVDGRPRAWTDLQLPLYRHALAPEWGDAIACGYLNLPKATGRTALALWDDYTRELHTAAMACAEGVCAAIRAGEFWPPNEEIRADSDDFAPLFHHGVAESVAWGPPS